MHKRRFPPPWSVIENDESFEVRDAAEQVIAYVYFTHGGLEIEMMRKRMSHDEARRIATAIARLPELLRRSE